MIVMILMEAACGRSAQSYLERGNILFSAGKYPEARFQYRASISKNPRFAEAYYRLGLTDAAMGDGTAALDALEQAQEFAPKNDQYGIAAADLSLEAYQEDPTDKKLYDQVNREAYDLLHRIPDSFDGLRLHADVLLIDRKYDEALAELRKADAIRPLDPKADVPMVRALFAENRTQEAESLAERVLAAHPDSAPMYDLLVSHYSKAQRTADVEHVLEAEMAGLPKDVRPRLMLASFYQESGRRQEMVATLEGIRKDRALFPNAPGLVGDFYAGAGDWQEALAQYQDGAKSAPKDKERYEQASARALAALGKPQEAIDQLTRVLKTNPDDFSARLTRAILLRNSAAPGDRDLAVADLKVLSGRAPSDAVTRYNLGVAYVANGDLTTGVTVLKEAADLRADYAAPRMTLAQLAEKSGDHAETVRLTGQILTADAGNRDAALLHADALVGIHSYSRARAELNGLLKSRPDSQPGSIDVNLRLAALDIAEHKYADAEARYLRLYRLGSDDLRPLEGLLGLYLTVKRPAKADALLQRELQQASGSEELHLLAAETAIREGKRGLAIQQYEWLCTNNPKSVDAWKSLGELYQAEGDLNRAISSYQKASELAPLDKDILYNLGLLQNDAGDKPAAIQTMKKELALDPQNAAVMNNLAFDLAETGTDLGHALTLAAAAARKLSGDPNVLDTLGWVYAKNGLNESAIQVFRVLVNKNPDLPVYRYHLGVAFLQDNKPNEAKDEFTIALSEKPPKELARRIREVSAKL